MGKTGFKPVLLPSVTSRPKAATGLAMTQSEAWKATPQDAPSAPCLQSSSSR